MRTPRPCQWLASFMKRPEAENKTDHLCVRFFLFDSVLVFKYANVSGLDHLINATILASVFSSAFPMFTQLSCLTFFSALADAQVFTLSRHVLRLRQLSHHAGSGRAGLRSKDLCLCRQGRTTLDGAVGCHFAVAYCVFR